MKAFALVLASLISSATFAASIGGKCTLSKDDGTEIEQFGMGLVDPNMRFGVFAEGNATTADVTVLLSNYERATGDMNVMISFPDGWANSTHVHIVGRNPSKIRAYSGHPTFGRLECKLEYRP